VQIPVTSKQYMFIPVTGPAGVDLTTYTPQIALMPDNGGEPGVGDWKAAAWLAPQAGAAAEPALLITAGLYPAGIYMAFVTLAAGTETPVIRSGRVRVGDTRS
jgi:hypothetical protein